MYVTVANIVLYSVQYNTIAARVTNCKEGQQYCEGAESSNKCVFPHKNSHSLIYTRWSQWMLERG